MNKLILTICFVLLFSINVFSQEAKKVGEFGYLPCNQLSGVMGDFYRYNNQAFKFTDSKIVVIFYGAERRKVVVSDFKGNYYTKTEMPIRGDARNRALDISLYLTNKYKVPKEKIEMIDGGFREDFEYEIWIVPKNVGNPKPTPRIDAKTIVYIDLEPSETRYCTNIPDAEIVNWNNKSEMEAKLYDEFGKIQCGDFMARIDSTVLHFDKNPYSKIYIVYYGGRYRRKKSWNQETRTFKISELKTAHRDDGLNWANAVILYLEDEKGRFGKLGEKILENIVLVNGGYKEDVSVQIWFIPNGGEPPKLRPKFTEKEINFKAKKPIPIQRFSQCYSSYKN